MTTPDHRPYLVEGDLRTPEDVLAWLDAGLTPPDGPMRLIGAWHFRIELAARLDREKRIACRRAVRTLLGPGCERLRAIKRNLRTAKHKSSPQWIDAYRNEWVNWEQTADRLMEERVTLVRHALAFRKEARKP